MVQTRSQKNPEHSSAQKSQGKPASSDRAPKTKPEAPKKKSHTSKDNSNNNKKRKSPPEPQEATEPPAKKAASKSTSPAETKGPSQSASDSKISKLFDTYGTFPLSDYGLEDPRSASAPTILAHLLHAVLTSARISHNLAQQTVRACTSAKYHHLDALSASTWEDRTKVLTDGGYTRYREKTATFFGELAELIRDRYEGDLNNLRVQAGDDADAIRARFKEVKGLGDVGVGIFVGTCQALWPCLAPAVDKRNLETARRIGIGGETQGLWEAVGKDAERMARLNMALTTIRLEGKEAEFE